MQRLQIVIVVFALALAVLLALVAWQTYGGLRQEESARLAFFTRTILRAIESELADLVVREEDRTVDEYNFTFAPPGTEPAAPIRSPLSRLPQEDFILGYLQNNPDGSFQTPLAADPLQAAPGLRGRVQQLAAVNRIFNRRKTDGVARRRRQPAKAPGVAAAELKKESRFSERFVVPDDAKTQRTYLGRKSQRLEEITADQARNLAQSKYKAAQGPAAAGSQTSPVAEGQADDAGTGREAAALLDPRAPAADTAVRPALPPVEPTAVADGRFQVEVAPLQSVFIDPQRIFLFRRIVIDERIYRQGLVIRTDALLRHLAAAHFEPQPMADFAGLTLSAADGDHPGATLEAGAGVSRARFRLQHTFPAPFDFLTATVRSENIPASASRRVVNTVLALLAVIFIGGFAAIFHSARTLVDLAERRARFVSSVTHELKTPLTNIRLYIEMLAQGMAPDPAREQAYFHILEAESERLARLIDNVLELSRLEKKQRPLEMVTGDFSEVLETVRGLMKAKLAHEGFGLTIEAREVPPFAYDREAMIQVLINLIENSLKFGRHSAERQITVRVATDNGHVRIAVSDTGPGIPRASLKKVFDDFYRVEDALTRTTGGTGIGLALVRQFVTAMGGTVSAAANQGPGCTISLRLPRV